jgi:hypothetical protein
MLNLLKSDVTYRLLITDGTYIDDISAKLTNRDMMGIVGKALSIGYSDFSIYVAHEHTKGTKEVKVLEMHNGDIRVNFDVVRILDSSEWTR